MPWGADVETGPSRFGLDAQVSVVADDHDLPGDAETQASTLPDGAGGEERFKQAVSGSGGEAGAGVSDFDVDETLQHSRSHGKGSVVSDGAQRVVEEVSPDLVQLARVGRDGGQVAVVEPIHLNSAEDAVLKDGEGGVQALVHVHDPVRGPVHLGVLLGGVHQGRDPRRGLPNLPRDQVRVHGVGQPSKHPAKGCTGRGEPSVLEGLGIKACRGETRCDPPAVSDVVLVEPVDELVLDTGRFEGAGVRVERDDPCRGDAAEPEVAAELVEHVRSASHGHQVRLQGSQGRAQGVGHPADGGGRVVQLVSQARREHAQRV